MSRKISELGFQRNGKIASPESPRQDGWSGTLVSLFNRLGRVNVNTVSAEGGLLLATMSMMALDDDIDADSITIIRRLDRSHRPAAWEALVKAFKNCSVP